MPGEGSSFLFSITATPAPFVPVSPSASLSSPRWLTSTTNIYIFESCKPASEVYRKEERGTREQVTKGRDGTARGRDRTEEKEVGRRRREGVVITKSYRCPLIAGTQKATCGEGFPGNPDDFREYLLALRRDQEIRRHSRVHQHPHLLRHRTALPLSAISSGNPFALFTLPSLSLLSSSPLLPFLTPLPHSSFLKLINLQVGFTNVATVFMGYMRPLNFESQFPTHDFLRKPIKESTLIASLREIWGKFDRALPHMARSSSTKRPAISQAFPLNILVVEGIYLLHSPSPPPHCLYVFLPSLPNSFIIFLSCLPPSLPLPWRINQFIF